MCLLENIIESGSQLVYGIAPVHPTQMLVCLLKGISNDLNVSIDIVKDQF